MSSKSIRYATSVFTVVLLGAACFAQTQTARLTGTVHYSTGSVVPNAKITAVNGGTKVTTEATTNASGDYVLPALQPGTYSLTVEATGFRKSVIAAIALDAAANVSQTITLEVGQLTEVIEVTANTINV